MGMMVLDRGLAKGGGETLFNCLGRGSCWPLAFGFEKACSKFWWIGKFGAGRS